jgi:hypothetical protein
MHIHPSMSLAAFALFAALLLFAGCTASEAGEGSGAEIPIGDESSWEGAAVGAANDNGLGEAEEEPPQVEANATEWGTQEAACPHRALEAHSEEYAGESEEQSAVLEETCGNISWAFDPPILSAKKLRREDGSVEYKFNRINLSGSNIVFAVLNETAVLVGAEREYGTINHYFGCEEFRAEGDTDTFTIGGVDYGYRRVMDLDYHGAMFEDTNQTHNFTLAFGEPYDFGDGIVFLWRTAPGMHACSSWAIISVFDKAVIVNTGEPGSGAGEAIIQLLEEENVQEGPIYEYPDSVFEDELRLAYISVPKDLFED